ncbi:MAG: hypothetical protein CVV44_03785 [Spirochaetae bacterium HGW-Spirochaetae-1]|jgi:integrase|nr:MAG: hypothetical protein CVV44_03785 [Spirochaetae bacterium HGW-Spirochaetae-1]
MADKPFSIFKRGKYYYVQFKMPDGTFGTAKSSRQTTIGRAEKWAVEYLQAGHVAQKGSTTFESFTKNFFSWDEEWAKNKRLAGKRTSERDCLEKNSFLEAHIVPHLGSMRLQQLDKKTIMDFRNKLFYDLGFSGSTVNKALGMIRSILEAAEDRRLIQFVPKIERVAQRAEKEKGILTIEEARKVLTAQWEDRRAHILSLAAASTGMRLGELLGLRIKNFHGAYIEIAQSWNEHLNRLNDSTKTGRARNVVIPGAVREGLQELVDVNPWIAARGEEAFIFFSPDHAWRPAHGDYLVRCFYRAMEQVGISEEARQARNITFHSWRYFLNSLLINSKIPLQKVQSITGHLTDEMSQHYYALSIGEMEDVRQIQEGIFSIDKKSEGDIKIN